MYSFTLFASSLALTAFHLVMISWHPMVDSFFVFITLRYCLSAIYTFGCKSTFCRLYHRMVARETIMADAYFMLKTDTTDIVFWFIILAIIGYTLSWAIRAWQRIDDPFTLLMQWVALLALGITHGLIINTFGK